MNRTRTTAAALAVAGVVTATQLGLAGAASAAPQSPGCPVSIVYPSRFYVDHSGWVTNGGLYFGVKSKTGKSFKKVTLTVTNSRNIRFSTAKATGGTISHRTSRAVSVTTPALKGKGSLGLRVRTHLLNTRSYQLKLALHGSGWNCAVGQGTWGA